MIFRPSVHFSKPDSSFRTRDHMTEPLSEPSRLVNRTDRDPANVIAYWCVEAVLEKKGSQVTVLDMRNLQGVADFFVVCEATSDIQRRAIADHVRETVRERCFEKPWKVEGYDHKAWILLDYVNVVVHVFDPERRSYYRLERLWGDADMVQVAEEGSAADVPFLSASAPDA